MLQCEKCEFFQRDEKGRIQLRCDPFSTIKEPECLSKWQLLRQDALLQAYQMTLQWYQRLAPMQEKMFEYMKREMDDIDESDSWKNQGDDDDDDDDEKENEKF